MKEKANRWEMGWLGGPILALRYRRAAQLDESHGLPFAAAMNWRKAAELSAWFTVLANSYWQQWERVMYLPRRLAGPIGLASAKVIRPGTHQTFDYDLSVSSRLRCVMALLAACDAPHALHLQCGMPVHLAQDAVRSCIRKRK